ncbi:uncharacterized protein [Coffea arabica]|uniref:Integrase catalytic domain-containing protein n=1 Tax=Coffea arabica TaxID=13443 RepID=A0ABM4X578_COFAR
MGCILGQHDESGKKEQAIYYLSKKFTAYEANYSFLERSCCVLAWATQKLRHYLLNHTTYLISRSDPLKYLLGKPMPTGRMAIWQMILSKFDIIFTTQKAIKGQVIADHLAKNSREDDYQPLHTYFPDEEVLFIDELVIEPIQIQLQEKPAHCLVIEKSSDGRPWYNDIKEFLKTGSYPPAADTTAKSFLHRLSSKFFLNGEVFYKRTSDLGLLRCVDEDEANYLMKEVHSGVCGSHMNEILIIDNVKNLINDMVDGLCEQFKIKYQNSTLYRPQMNGVVEAANKNLKKIISKMTERHRDWHEKLPCLFMAYRTAIQTSIGATPYNLMYGMETVLPAEVEIPSLRILMEVKLDETD